MFTDWETQAGSKAFMPPLSRADLLALPVGEAIAALTRTPRFDRTVQGDDRLAARLHARLARLLRRAFGEGDEVALADVHRALFTLYDLHVADPATPAAINQFDPFLTGLRGTIERHWLAAEHQRIGAVPVFETPDALIAAVRKVVAAHPASHHPLFDLLEAGATREQLERFFRSDTALNVRFFDLIVMSMIGSRPEARKELASNFWDEVGRGDPQRSHVQLFRQLLLDVGITPSGDDFASTLTWQGLRGYNLFMLCALNRQHYYKLLGVMAATELLDPPQYRKLIVGCRRLGLGPSTTRYYDEHITVDDIHGEGWLENVIRPLARREPRAMSEVWVGCMLRLASCNDYYDALHRQVSLMTRVEGSQAGDDHDHHPRKKRSRPSPSTHEGTG
ncbi:iron-containing redox enzyme family protein [Caballeronia ptereochthonis]|uniref:Spermidine/putrescine ABC transporter n=1 Tax=Caballeronia ptereochthonis TaxID=1777144 RepID=A0A157Z429_9BURK|nr:iron-containing redox enzyme family protein [Caballeronia ptereochthonis]SAK39767.1 spermidine/putrescine ABC transporter [Caballeronia ptereochthonis]